jgi:hypothetical protein
VVGSAYRVVDGVAVGVVEHGVNLLHLMYLV